MHLDRRIKIRLAIFIIISVVATTVLTIGYAQAPALLFGVGRYVVTLHLDESAGLYDRANVTYRGTEVGQVEEVTLTDTGVEAILSMDSKFTIPSNLDAEVHSQSAIGEQFLALVPRNGTSRPLRAGDVIAADRTSVPPDINGLLDKTNIALQAIPGDNLRTLIDESYVAFGGLGPQFARAIDGATKLATDAKTNIAELTNVIDHSAPILDSQSSTADDVTAWAANVATAAKQLEEHNAAVSGILRKGGPATGEAQALLDRLNPTLPVVMANLLAVADVALVYQPNLEQLLVLVPQNLAQLLATIVPNLHNNGFFTGTTQEFSTNLNLPPPCLTGYLPASQRRSPVLEDTPPRPPGDFYCRIPQDSPLNVRGARNIPCAGKPWKRAPTVAICESDEEYVPLNNGDSWKGDPNATTTGQGVPQFSSQEASPIAVPPGATPLPGAAPPSPDGRPPASTPPAALGVAEYNPANGTYIARDGQVYTQTNLAQDAKPPTLQSMLVPPSAG